VVASLMWSTSSSSVRSQPCRIAIAETYHFLCLPCSWIKRSSMISIRFYSNKAPFAGSQKMGINPNLIQFSGLTHMLLQFYFACIVRCIGLCHYYQGEHNNSETGIKRMEKGSRNWRKAESENISLYATLQEPEFRCFTLNS
jgi:hypothetical protein